MLRDFYSVPVYTSDISADALQDLQELQNEQNYQQNPQWRSHHISDLEFIGLPCTDTVKQELEFHGSRYLEMVGATPRTMRLRSAWFTQTQPGEYAHIHSHQHNDISGVVYTQATPDQGSIFFPRPWPQIGMTHWLSHSPDVLEIEPHTGLIILFPSWLEHGIRTNTSTTNRYSYAFNALAE
jgi:uncharacterized protein (TIGR02466 family)